MDTWTILNEVAARVQEKKFGDAQDLLTRGRSRARADGDVDSERFIVSELIELYCLKEPPDTDLAEVLSLEREALDPSAQSKLQTAMLLYWHKHEPAPTLVKLNEGLIHARGAGESSVAYSCLSLSGLALLDLGRIHDAEKVLAQIEQMVVQRESFVVGDEILFLERSRSAGMNPSRLARVASLLIPICRDPRVVERLKELTES